MPDAAFTTVLAAGLIGLLLSIAVERLLQPVPRWRREVGAWSVHAGLLLLTYGALTLPLGRPWFAMAGVLAFLLMLVLVNNAKMKALREPFVFQDYEYFTDAIRHPRLYIPFLGWPKFLGAAAGFGIAVAIGWWLEEVPEQRHAGSGQLGGVVLVLTSGLVLLVCGARRLPAVGFKPARDVPALGLLASLWAYACAGRRSPEVKTPFDSLPATEPPSAERPHMVAVQSESFFDVRALHAGIRREVLAEYDALKRDADRHGRLRVPAWGANTVRTEFAFLSGLAAGTLGVHRFNPYRAVAAGWPVASLASYLKRLGYRTVCIHPYPASFYLRSTVYPRLGFDEFVDIRAFSEGDRAGPYVGDEAVAAKVAELLGNAVGPLFLFVITMENHGPLHLESVAPGDVDALYSTPPPDDCDDLTIYLRHLRNADRMVAALRATLGACPQPASLCWYGDHVPILPKVYEAFGTPEGDVEYVFWSNFSTGAACCAPLEAQQLSQCWLQQNGLLPGEAGG